MAALVDGLFRSVLQQPLRIPAPRVRWQPRAFLQDWVSLNLRYNLPTGTPEPFLESETDEYPNLNLTTSPSASTSTLQAAAESGDYDNAELLLREHIKAGFSVAPSISFFKPAVIALQKRDAEVFLSWLDYMPMSIAGDDLPTDHLPALDWSPVWAYFSGDKDADLLRRTALLIARKGWMDANTLRTIVRLAPQSMVLPLIQMIEELDGTVRGDAGTVASWLRHGDWRIACFKELRHVGKISVSREVLELIERSASPRGTKWALLRSERKSQSMSVSAPATPVPAPQSNTSAKKHSASRTFLMDPSRLISWTDSPGIVAAAVYFIREDLLRSRPTAPAAIAEFLYNRLVCEFHRHRLVALLLRRTRRLADEEGRRNLVVISMHLEMHRGYPMGALHLYRQYFHPSGAPFFLDASQPSPSNGEYWKSLRHGIGKAPLHGSTYLASPPALEAIWKAAVMLATRKWRDGPWGNPRTRAYLWGRHRHWSLVNPKPLQVLFVDFLRQYDIDRARVEPLHLYSPAYFRIFLKAFVTYKPTYAEPIMRAMKVRGLLLDPVTLVIFARTFVAKRKPLMMIKVIDSFSQRGFPKPKFDRESLRATRKLYTDEERPGGPVKDFYAAGRELKPEEVTQRNLLKAYNIAMSSLMRGNHWYLAATLAKRVLDAGYQIGTNPPTDRILHKIKTMFKPPHEGTLFLRNLGLEAAERYLIKALLTGICGSKQLRRAEVEKWMAGMKEDARFGFRVRKYRTATAQQWEVLREAELVESNRVGSPVSIPSN
jgi:hypothetical protein